MMEKIITENVNPAAQVFEGKKRTNKKPIIGIDPLAWLKEESEDAKDIFVVDEDHIEESVDEIQQDIHPEKSEEVLEQTVEVVKSEPGEVAEFPNEFVEEEYLAQVVEEVQPESDEITKFPQGLAEDDLEPVFEVSKSQPEEIKEPSDALKEDKFEEAVEELEPEIEETVESLVDDSDEAPTEVIQITDQQKDTELEMQIFKLEGIITIADVAELHDQFKTFFDKGQDLEINCSEVSSVDAAALQLLVVFMKDTNKKENKVIWQEPSDSFQATLELMGFKDEFRM